MKQRQILTNYKANRQMRVGATVKVMLVGVFAVGFAACQSPLGMATNRDQNEPLRNQPADVEQNLLMSQKQGVNGAREPNSPNVPLLKTLKGQVATVDGVSFSPDGQMIASVGVWDDTIKLWKPDGTLIKTLRGHTNNVFSVSFSPDGQILASGGDETIRLRKPNGTLIQTLKGHKGPVWSISFSPDGQTLASGSADGTVKLWNLNEVASPKITR